MGDFFSEELYSTQLIDGHDVNIYQMRDGRYKIMVDGNLMDVVREPEIAEFAVKYYIQGLEDGKTLD